MAANRTESTDSPEGAAPPAPAPAREGGGAKSWLPLILTVILMPVLAYGMTMFVLLPQLQKSLGITAAAASAAEAGDKAKADASGKHTTVVLNKLLVNVAGTMGARYLLVSLSMVSSDSDFAQKVQDHEAQMRDMASGALCTKTIADLEKPDARNLIRSELIAGFNNIFGTTEVQEIYLTEFAIQ